jgi:hypothetical protein
VFPSVCSSPGWFRVIKNCFAEPVDHCPAFVIALFCVSKQLVANPHADQTILLLTSIPDTQTPPKHLRQHGLTSQCSLFSLR